jgi:hypothetical protein
MESVTNLCLKAMTRLHQTQSKLLKKYNLLQAEKHPKQELLSAETPLETAHATHAPPQDIPLQQPKTRKPLGTTKPGKDTKRGHHALPKV